MWAHRALAICSLWKIYTCLFAPKCTRTLALTRSKKKASQKVKTVQNFDSICATFNLHLCYNFALLLQHRTCVTWKMQLFSASLTCNISTNVTLLIKKLFIPWRWLASGCHVLQSLFHPLHPNASLHMLHTLLQTFPKVLIKRICLTIKSFFSWWSFPLIWWP